MSKRAVKITISGPGLLPETTRASELGDFLRNIEKAVFETAKAQVAEISDEDIVSLTKIEASSNKLTFAVAGLLIPGVVCVSQAIKTKKYETLPRQAHEALHEVSAQAVRHKWEVKFDKNTSLNIRGGSISEENQVPPAPPPPHIEGTTSIYGRCIRVGGKTPKAIIELYQGKSLPINLSEDMAKELAKSLYEDVCIEGKAKWNTEDLMIAEFEAVRICEFRATDAVTAFKNLAAAAKGRWDRVDAIKYVEGLRSEGEKA